MSNLQQTRNSQGAQLVPRTDVPLAKSHLDAARVLFLLNRPQEANVEVQSAESLLRDLVVHQRDNPLPSAWLWRISYLLGDISLYENHESIALQYYEQARALNPDFVPASAMVEYLSDAGSAPQLPSAGTVAPGDHNGGSLTVPPDNSAPEPQSPTVPQPRASGTLAPTPQLVSAPPNVSSAAPTPAPQRVVSQADTPGALYHQLQQISSSGVLPKAAQFVTLVAEIFEVTELTPLAGALTLAGMIVDYAVKP